MSFAIDTFPTERFGLVTGSKCTVMFPVRGDGVIGMTTYAKQLANEKFFQFYDEKSAWQMEHGKMAEHFAMIHYKDYFNKDVVQGGWYVKDDCGGSTDAETRDSIIDFKCPVTLEGWLDFLYDKLDKKYYDQLQMYMYLTGKEKAEIAAYLTETQFMTDNGLTYPVQEDKRMIIVKVEKDKGWESKLQEQLPFVIEMRDKYIEVLNQKFNL
jgi:hypothetical protein